MVKKGEYVDYAISLEEKLIDSTPFTVVKENEMVLGTHLAMTVEIAKLLKELEERIIELEKVIL